MKNDTEGIILCGVASIFVVLAVWSFVGMDNWNGLLAQQAAFWCLISLRRTR